MFNKYGLILVTAISVSSQFAIAGGDGSEFDSLAAELAGSSADSGASTGNLSSAASSTSLSGSSNANTNPEAVNNSVSTSQKFQQKSDTPPSQPPQSSRASGFDAIEDEQLVIDTSNIQDGDGIGSTQIQWQISDNGDDWQIIPGAITPSFTPRDAHVNRYLRVIVSYVDGQGNSETIISPNSSAVQNVNDKPVGVPTIIGEARENNSLTIDNSRITDEDGIGTININWERSTTKSNWERLSDKVNTTVSLKQIDVGYSYRAVVNYIDGFGSVETLYTEPTELVANVDNPLTGEIIIRGQAIENNELVVSLSSLADYDGIASTAFNWEASADGRTWDIINLPANSPTLLLGQALVGLKIRISANIVDNFGVETKITSAITGPVRNVNDKPVGSLLIRRVGS
ncbi:MAG: hypothetical protein HOI17_08405 [Alphaproteobacteria bacterium]|nr:hypothetical protein [Alphaproteobacteria bacterium]